MSNTLSLSAEEILQADATVMQQVLMRLSWASRRRMAHEMESYHLTVPQFMTLRAIQHHSGENCNMSQLAEASHQVAATMTGIIDRLVERGLVERRRDTADRRVLRIALTLQGEDLLAQIDQFQQQRMLHTLSSFSPQERQSILRLMEHYLEVTLDEVEATSGQRIAARNG